MAAGLPLSESELRLLSALVKHKVRFMLVGLSAAALQGAPVVTEDVDLWFENLDDPKLALALRSVGATYVPPFQLNPPMIVGDAVEAFDVVLRMDGLESFNAEYSSALAVKLGMFGSRCFLSIEFWRAKRQRIAPRIRPSSLRFATLFKQLL